MKLLVIVMVIMALDQPVLARTPSHMNKKVAQQLAGKEVLRSLIQQTPWDRARLAHILKLEKLKAVTAPDYVPNASALLDKLVRAMPRQEKLAKLLLWKVTTKRGSQHWLLGTNHLIRLGVFSAEARQQLDALMADIDVYIHEGEALTDAFLHVGLYSTLDHQLTIMAQRQGKRVVPLEDSFEMQSIEASLLATEEKVKLQREKQLETISETELEPYILEMVGELETVFRRMQAYLRGDLTALMEIDQQDLDRDSEFAEEFLGIRNRNWMPKITKACHSQETCLIAAGYGHFLYDSETVASIITMLREQGYIVEPFQP